MMLRAVVDLAGRSRMGERHRVEGRDNEDVVFTSSRHTLFDAVIVLSDGMGGHPLPLEAATAAVEAAQAVILSYGAGAAGAVPALLQQSFRAAARSVAEFGSESGKQPGCTLSLAVLRGDNLSVLHCGDGSVWFCRAGTAQLLLGGEQNRRGNRPAAYLGQAEPLDPEPCHLRLKAGDRLLMATDGLTRALGADPAPMVGAILSRDGLEASARAGQLLSHGRPEAYEDDTTLAVLEVVSFEDRPEPRFKSAPAAGAAPAQRRTPRPAVGAVAALALFFGAVGFAIGRFTAPVAAPITGGSDPTPVPPDQEPAALEKLPTGNLVLIDPLGRRLFSLGTRDGTPPNEPVDLQALKLGADGRLARIPGEFRFDPKQRTLDLPDGTRVPVDPDTRGGQLRIVVGGVLTVITKKPGAKVWVDDRQLGTTPFKRVISAGRKQIRVDEAGKVSKHDVDVKPGRTTVLNLSSS